MKPALFDDLMCVFLAGAAAAVIFPLCLAIWGLCSGASLAEQDFTSVMAFCGLTGAVLGIASSLAFGMPAMLFLRRTGVDRPLAIVPVGAVIGVLTEFAAFHWHRQPIDSIAFAAVVGAFCGYLASYLRMRVPASGSA